MSTMTGYSDKLKRRFALDGAFNEGNTYKAEALRDAYRWGWDEAGKAIAAGTNENVSSPYGNASESRSVKSAWGKGWKDRHRFEGKAF